LVYNQIDTTGHQLTSETLVLHSKEALLLLPGISLSLVKLHPHPPSENIDDSIE